MCRACHRRAGVQYGMICHAIAMQRFPEAVIGSYALILLALRATETLFHAGMLTRQRNYRFVNAVIVRFCVLGRIINIMRRVSECYILGAEGWPASIFSASASDGNPDYDNYS